MATPNVEEVKRRLLSEPPRYAGVVKIIDKRGEQVSLVPRPAQLLVEDALKRQRDAGLPERIIVLKSRQTGISTWIEVGHMLPRCTLQQNRKGLVVAHDNDTAGSLFGMAHNGYVNLPEEEWIKPPLVSIHNSESGRKLMHWGEPSRIKRARGELGLNSQLRIDTAKEVSAGRGKTIHLLHCSEVAHWPDPGKAASLLAAVPNEPGTLIVLESTANGRNFFEQRWKRAERGEGSFVPVFIGWTIDPDCRTAFPTEDERAAFVETIGEGPYGADEAMLIERFGVTPEQLYWRRLTIVDECDGDLATFKQEYPSSPAEAFKGSGNHAFSFVYIERAIEQAGRCDPPEGAGLGDGLLLPSGTRPRRVHDGEVDVPVGALWVPRTATGFGDAKDWWRLWEYPYDVEKLGQRHERGEITQAQFDELVVPDRARGQYVIAADVSGGEEATSTGDRAYHAVQVINHHTLEQVAQWRSRCDADQLVTQLLLAGLFFNGALIAVETTGAWGLPVIRQLRRRYGYRWLYRRRPVGQRQEKAQELDGWDTNRRTKPLLEANLTELLREGTHGMRSLLLADELTTYIRDANGKTRPDSDAFSDLLMAYMIGQYVAQQVPPRPEKRPGERRGGGWEPHNPVTGY